MAFLKKRVNCKHAIMEQHVVACVGNIYANEALFEAGINPPQLTHQLSLNQCAALVRAIKAVLRKVIAECGTTLKDFLNPDDKRGLFRPRLLIYGRSGKTCRKCNRSIHYRLSA
ncbi:formamidopyrimidine-DNA glycosylase [Coxiella-like endosymbiont of Rhipicephalus sanguineus]|uniref:formamidopyrimidine-DNA glycosylase n=1 Tax=Coxiella-like endosymbiont of Rhipicephalus sanguineus TaxID=1955402 RepID=UPI0027DF9D5F|nr:formamidopyrimidine-DNA glycosylase [Coxiella-like endosymbiont of Rhipicephalus sanguineus]